MSHIVKLSEKNQERLSKIIHELSEGLAFIQDIQNAVTIFGSSRFFPDNEYYTEAEKLAKLLTEEKFTVITGAGPGIMEAANKGAYEAHGNSIGINIDIPKHQPQNKFVTKSICVDHFYIRKLMMVIPSVGFVFFPGGFGTLDEFFEMMNLVETNELNKKPLLIAVGKKYWQPLLDWLKNDVAEKNKAFAIKDLDVIRLVDSAEEAFEIIKKFE